MSRRRKYGDSTAPKNTPRRRAATEDCSSVVEQPRSRRLRSAPGSVLGVAGEGPSWPRQQEQRPAPASCINSNPEGETWAALLARLRHRSSTAQPLMNRNIGGGGGGGFRQRLFFSRASPEASPKITLHRSSESLNPECELGSARWARPQHGSGCGVYQFAGGLLVPRQPSVSSGETRTTSCLTSGLQRVPWGIIPFKLPPPPPPTCFRERLSLTILKEPEVAGWNIP